MPTPTPEAIVAKIIKLEETYKSLKSANVDTLLTDRKKHEDAIKSIDAKIVAAAKAAKLTFEEPEKADGDTAETQVLTVSAEQLKQYLTEHGNGQEMSADIIRKALKGKRKQLVGMAEANPKDFVVRRANPHAYITLK